MSILVFVRSFEVKTVQSILTHTSRVATKFKLDSVIRMSTGIKLLHDQLHAKGLARLEILARHNENDGNVYLKNINDEEAFNIANMMEG